MYSHHDTDTKHDFNDLLNRYGALINKVCYFYAVDLEDFNDLRQEALINIWRGMPKFRGDSNASTWIYRITLNSCVSFFRKNKRHVASESIENYPEIISADEEKTMMVRELYSMINRLGDIDKAVILMWLEGYDYNTISEVVGLNKTTVGTRVHRIKEKLVEISNS